MLLVPEQATEQHLQLLSELAQMFCERAFRDQPRRRRPTPPNFARCSRDWQPAMNARARAMRQVSVEQLFDDNRERLGLTWLAGRQGGSRVLTGESALEADDRARSAT